MFLCEEQGGYKLPDVSMYGGDTTPWSIIIVKQDGTPYPFASLTGSAAKLALTPYAISTGLGANAESIAPVLVKTGTVTSDPSGTATVLFSLTKADTINLRGKYIYQVELSKDSELRVLQGFVTIKQNINRT